MCSDLNPSKFNSEVPNIQKSISQHLTYASLHFMQHVLNGLSKEEEIQSQIDTFLKKKLLQWFEALSLIGHLKVAITSLKQIDEWYKVGEILLPRTGSQDL
jgi:hypothetical protein